MMFLGLLQYLAKLVPYMSDISAQLRKLLEGDETWHWVSKQQKSFERLKSLVSNTPVLKYFGLKKEVMLSVVARRTTSGILAQGLVLSVRKDMPK